MLRLTGIIVLTLVVLLCGLWTPRLKFLNTTIFFNITVSLFTAGIPRSPGSCFLRIELLRQLQCRQFRIGLYCFYLLLSVAPSRSLLSMKSLCIFLTLDRPTT